MKISLIYNTCNKLNEMLNPLPIRVLIRRVSSIMTAAYPHLKNEAQIWEKDAISRTDSKYMRNADGKLRLGSLLVEENGECNALWTALNNNEKLINDICAAINAMGYECRISRSPEKWTENRYIRFSLYNKSQESVRFDDDNPYADIYVRFGRGDSRKNTGIKATTDGRFWAYYIGGFIGACVRIANENGIEATPRDIMERVIQRAHNVYTNASRLKREIRKNCMTDLATYSGFSDNDKESALECIMWDLRSVMDFGDPGNFGFMFSMFKYGGKVHLDPEDSYRFPLTDKDVAKASNAVRRVSDKTGAATIDDVIGKALNAGMMQPVMIEEKIPREMTMPLWNCADVVHDTLGVTHAVHTEDKWERYGMKCIDEFVERDQRYAKSGII